MVVASLLVISIPVSVLPDVAAGLLTLLYFAFVIAFAFGYPVFFVATRGATPGKGFLGLVVVDRDNRYPVGWGKALLREILGKQVIDKLTIYLGYLLIAFDPRKQGLHDKIAGTYVVHKDSLAPAGSPAPKG